MIYVHLRFQRYIFVLMLSSGPLLSYAQQIRDVFKLMPDTVMPYLSSNNRLDFIDFMDSNMKAEVKNLFGGTSEMTALTNDSLSIRMSNALRIDMMLLPIEEPIDSTQTIICLAQTYCIDSLNFDSQFSYYSIHWNKVDQPLLPVTVKKRIETLKMQTFLKRREKLKKRIKIQDSII